MAITAKSILLTDENGVNVSPVTNLESLYIEVLKNDDRGVQHTYRKFIYQNWPMHVELISVPAVKWINSEIPSATTDTPQKPANGKLNDIFVSGVTEITGYEGTNYNAIKYYNVNLSNLLAPLAEITYVNHRIAVTESKADTYINDICTNLHNEIINVSTNVNKQLQDIDSSLKILESVFNISAFEDNQAAKTAMTNHELIPGVLYDLPYGLQDDDPTMDKSVYFTAIADTSSSFSQNIINVRARTINNAYFHTDLSKMEIIYDCSSNTVLYMKDANNNEADYDFKHLNEDLNVSVGRKTGLILCDHIALNNIVYIDATEALFTSFSITCRNNKFTSYDCINIHYFGHPCNISIYNNEISSNATNNARFDIYSKPDSTHNSLEFINNTITDSSIGDPNNRWLMFASYTNNMYIEYKFNNNIISHSQILHDLEPTTNYNELTYISANIYDNIIMNSRVIMDIDGDNENGGDFTNCTVSNVNISNCTGDIVLKTDKQTASDFGHDKYLNIVLTNLNTTVPSPDCSIFYTHVNIYALHFIENNIENN